MININWLQRRKSLATEPRGELEQEVSSLSLIFAST